MTFRTATLALTMSLAIPAAAHAQGAQDDVFRKFCSGDYMRLCSQFDPGSAEVRQCFIAHMRQLSPTCRRAIASSGKRKARRRRR
jgi:hypothetical protein